MATRTTKILIGCGIAVAACCLLFVGSCVGFAVWLQRPGQLLDPRQLVDEKTTGYAEWTLREDDRATVDALIAVLEAQEKMNAAQMSRSQAPDWLKTLMQFSQGQQARQRRQQVEEFLPSVVTWSMRPTDVAGQDRHVLSVSMESMGNRGRMADWFLETLVSRDPSFVAESHADEVIFGPASEPVRFFLRNATVFVATDPDGARWAADRLQSTAAPGEPTDLEQMLTELPPVAALRGVVTNESGEIARILEQVGKMSEEEARAASRDVRALRWNGGFEGAIDLVVDVEIVVDRETTRERARQLADGLVRAVEDADSPLAAEVLEVEPPVARVQLSVRDIEGQVDQWLAQATSQRRGGATPPTTASPPAAPSDAGDAGGTAAPDGSDAEGAR